MIFCHPVNENPPVLCSAQLHLKYCEGGENWLMFEVGEENVKDWVFRTEKVPASWVMVGHSRRWWRAPPERLGDFSPTNNGQPGFQPPWDTAQPHTEAETFYIVMTDIGESRSVLSDRVTVWRNDENMRWWDWSDMKGPVPGRLRVLAGHREKYPQEVSIILDMFCCPSQLLISWIYIISLLFSSDQAEHYVRSPDTFTIFSSLSARSITRPEFETILGFNRSIFLSKAQHGQ